MWDELKQTIRGMVFATNALNESGVYTPSDYDLALETVLSIMSDIKARTKTGGSDAN